MRRIRRRTGTAVRRIPRASFRPQPARVRSGNGTHRRRGAGICASHLRPEPAAAELRHPEAAARSVPRPHSGIRPQLYQIHISVSEYAYLSVAHIMRLFFTFFIPHRPPAAVVRNRIRASRPQDLLRKEDAAAAPAAFRLRRHRPKPPCEGRSDPPPDTARPISGAEVRPKPDREQKQASEPGFRFRPFRRIPQTGKYRFPTGMSGVLAYRGRPPCRHPHCLTTTPHLHAATVRTAPGRPEPAAPEATVPEPAVPEPAAPEASRRCNFRFYRTVRRSESRSAFAAARAAFFSARAFTLSGSLPKTEKCT